MQLWPNNWPKFQEQLKKMYSAEICQTLSQIKQNEQTSIPLPQKKICRKLWISNWNKYYKGKIAQIIEQPTNSQNR